MRLLVNSSSLLITMKEALYTTVNSSLLMAAQADKLFGGCGYLWEKVFSLLNHRWLECSVELLTGGVQPYCRYVVCGRSTLPFWPHKMVASISHLGKTRLWNFLRSEGQCIAATIVLSEESFVVIDTSYPSYPGPVLCPRPSHQV